MNLDEYREWLKEKGNLEEVKATEVAEEIIRWHARNISTPWGETYKVDLTPRKLLKADGKYYECDLVIKLSWKNRRGQHKTMLIGVEFKEWDFSKVVEQAIYRRQFFDYMYIATRPVTLSLTWEPHDFAILIKYGIGWVLWSEEFVYLLLPAKKRGWERAEEMAKKIEDLMNRPLKEPKTIADYVR